MNEFNNQEGLSVKDQPGNRCVGYIMNKFEQVLRDGAKARGCPKVNKFEQVLIGHTGTPSCEQTDRFTDRDMSENITFLHSVAGGNNDAASTGSHFKNFVPKLVELNKI